MSYYVKENVILTDEWQQEVKKVTAKFKSSKEIPGFRKGHTPDDIIFKNFGMKIFDEAVHNAVSQKMEQLRNSANLISEPDVKITKLNKDEMEYSLTYMTIATLPEFSFTDNEIKMNAVEVKKEDEEREVEHFLNQYADFVPDEEPISEEHFVIYKRDDKMSNQPELMNQHPLFSHLAGQKSGFKADVDGASIEVVDVLKKTVPTLDEKFIADYGEMLQVTSAEQLKEKISSAYRENIRRNAEMKAIEDFLFSNCDRLINELDPEYHQDLDKFLEDFQATELAAYEKHQAECKDEEHAHQHQKPNFNSPESKKELLERIVRHLMNKAIIEKGNLSVTEEDMEKYRMMYNLSAEMLEKNQEMQSRLYNVIMQQKLVSYLAENNRLVEVVAKKKEEQVK